MWLSTLSLFIHDEKLTSFTSVLSSLRKKAKKIKDKSTNCYSSLVAILRHLEIKIKGPKDVAKTLLPRWKNNAGKLPLRCQESKVCHSHCCTLAFSRVGASVNAMKGVQVRKHLLERVCYVLFSICHNICGELTTMFLEGHYGLVHYIDTKAKCRHLKNDL
jgi:hypothetical protein